MTKSILTRLLLLAACSHGEPVLTDLNLFAEAADGKGRLERMNKALGG
ncbi:hypothetical protein [Ensifer sp. LC163]|nr:hypothetical protein [Ensifer sp. LC163]